MTSRVGILFVSLSTIVGLALEYAFYRWAVAHVPALRARRRAFAAGLVAFVLASPIARVLVFYGAPEGLAIFEAAVQLWTLALLAASPLVLAIEGVRLLLRWRAAPSREPEQAPNARREVLVTMASGAAVTVSASVLAWGAVRTRFDLELVEVPIRVPRLPRVLDGFTIVQVSDIHVGTYLGARELAHGEQLISGLKPDLVAMTGDLVHLNRRHLPLACDWLSRLGGRARFGALAIFGNHEYYVGVDAVRAAYRAAKIDLLFNEARRIAVGDGGGIGVVGVDDVYGGTSGRGRGPRWSPALNELDPERPRILLCHQPHLHRKAALEDFDLQLSGHTHGGQIAPFGPLAARALYGPIAGHAQLRRPDGGDFHLWINRGYGTSGPPSRVAVRPEITKIVLVSA